MAHFSIRSINSQAGEGKGEICIRPCFEKKAFKDKRANTNSMDGGCVYVGSKTLRRASSVLYKVAEQEEMKYFSLFFFFLLTFIFFFLGGRGWRWYGVWEGRGEERGRGGGGSSFIKEDRRTCAHNHSAGLAVHAQGRHKHDVARLKHQVMLLVH